MNQQDAALVLDMLMLMERTSLPIYHRRIQEAISIMAPLAQPYNVVPQYEAYTLPAKDLREARSIAMRYAEAWIQKKGKTVEIWRGKERSL